MRARKLAISSPIVASLVLTAVPCPAKAAVLIKTFDFSICVTGKKHPDACKGAGADAHVVVSDDAMEGLEGKIGQGASIMAYPQTGESSAPGQKGFHRHRRQAPESPDQ